jgi:hypothetical protein
MIYLSVHGFRVVTGRVLAEQVQLQDNTVAGVEGAASPHLLTAADMGMQPKFMRKHVPCVST